MSEAVTTGAEGAQPTSEGAAAPAISDAELDAALKHELGIGEAEPAAEPEAKADEKKDDAKQEPAKTEEPAPSVTDDSAAKAEARAERKRAIGQVLAKLDENWALKNQRAKERLQAAKLSEREKQAQEREARVAESDAKQKALREAFEKKDLVAAAAILGIDPGKAHRDFTAKALNKESPEGKLDEALSPFRQQMEQISAALEAANKKNEELASWRKAQEEKEARAQKEAEERTLAAQRAEAEKQARSEFLHAMGKDPRYDALRDYFDHDDQSVTDEAMVQRAIATKREMAAEGKPARSYAEILDRMLADQEARVKRAYARQQAREQKQTAGKQDTKQGEKGNSKPTSVPGDMAGQQGASSSGPRSKSQADAEFEAHLAANLLRAG